MGGSRTPIALSLAAGLVLALAGPRHPALSYYYTQPPRIEVEPTIISPNGDGCRDQTIVSVGIPGGRPGTVMVDVYRDWSQLVWSQRAGAPDGVATIVWRGGDDLLTTVVPDGWYRMVVTVRRGRDVLGIVERFVTVDTRAPQVTYLQPGSGTATVSVPLPVGGPLGASVPAGVAMSATVAAFFDEPLDPLASSLAVVPSAGLRPTGYHYNGYNEVGFRASFPGLVGTYTATASVADHACNRSGATWGFLAAAPF